MFDQITNLNGHEWYLIFSLSVFMVFFVVVGILLFFMKKDHIRYMSHVPLDDETEHMFYPINPDQDDRP